MQLTQADLDLVFETEEIIDHLRSAGTEKIQKEMGSTTIAFFDFASMGTFTGLLYIVAIGGLLGFVINLLFQAVQPQPDLAKQRREKIEQRKKK